MNLLTPWLSKGEMVSGRGKYTDDGQEEMSSSSIHPYIPLGVIHPYIPPGITHLSEIDRIREAFDGHHYVNHLTAGLRGYMIEVIHHLSRDGTICACCTAAVLLLYCL